MNCSFAFLVWFEMPMPLCLVRRAMSSLPRSAIPAQPVRADIKWLQIAFSVGCSRSPMLLTVRDRYDYLPMRPWAKATYAALGDGCKQVHFIYPLLHLLGYILLSKGSATQGSSQILATVLDLFSCPHLSDAPLLHWAMILKELMK